MGLVSSPSFSPLSYEDKARRVLTVDQEDSPDQHRVDGHLDLRLPRTTGNKSAVYKPQTVLFFSSSPRCFNTACFNKQRS